MLTSAFARETIARSCNEIRRRNDATLPAALPPLVIAEEARAACARFGKSDSVAQEFGQPENASRLAKWQGHERSVIMKKPVWSRAPCAVKP
jgi:hypothetical protein